VPNVNDETPPPQDATAAPMAIADNSAIGVEEVKVEIEQEVAQPENEA
jgi:hypothetical protein